MRILVLVFLGIALCTAVARDAREQQRIAFLIETVGSLKGAVFIRNGSEHDAHAAAEHLRSKLSYAGERVKTAEEFVKYCASESSLTHRPYQIRFADGRITNASPFFLARLTEFDSAHP